MICVYPWLIGPGLAVASTVPGADRPSGPIERAV
jgi:hypothetical protein